MNSINNIRKSIDQHLILLSKILEYSNLLYKATVESNETVIYDLTDSRDLMIKDLYNLQNNICEKLELVPANLLNDSIIAFIKSWNNKLVQTTTKVENLDSQIINELEKRKETLTKEIATVFHNRKSISGYNLENVKRK